MNFTLARLPRIEFGCGTLEHLPRCIRTYGSHALLVTGASALTSSPHWNRITALLSQSQIEWSHVRVAGEPSPAFVDQTVAEHRLCEFDCVVGIGGGSALDAAKAIAGLLKPGNSVMDHLEGVGPEHPYLGPSTPFIAIPTTAGTGSEATKNAVLSVHGSAGFKKSFRDDKLVAEWALIDPDLLASCPPEVLAANGMDAFTQLLESYVSTKANPLTDALARSGMELVEASLLPWFDGTGNLSEHQAGMAYAALLSGITLAQVGLGSVHGLASPLGAFFPIPHGVVCGTLVAVATRVNLAAMRRRDPQNPAIQKYAEVGRLLAKNSALTQADALAALLNTLDSWTQRLPLPRLGFYGIKESDVAHIVQHSRGSSMKTNPIVLTDAEIAEIVRARL